MKVQKSCSGAPVEHHPRRSCCGVQIIRIGAPELRETAQFRNLHCFCSSIDVEIEISAEFKAKLSKLQVEIDCLDLPLMVFQACLAMVWQSLFFEVL